MIGKPARGDGSLSPAYSSALMHEDSGDAYNAVSPNVPGRHKV
ncbi:MAG TPA: hypothetical protein VGN34_02705 [Ktedonobacteraceae bacterium]